MSEHFLSNHIEQKKGTEVLIIEIVLLNQRILKPGYHLLAYTFRGHHGNTTLYFIWDGDHSWPSAENNFKLLP